MTVTEAERQKIIQDIEEKRKRELSEKMRALGKIRSVKKRRAALKNVKKAQAAKWGKKFPGLK
jgi:heme exporter protein D